MHPHALLRRMLILTPLVMVTWLVVFFTTSAHAGACDYDPNPYALAVDGGTHSRCITQGQYQKYRFDVHTEGDYTVRVQVQRGDADLYGSRNNFNIQPPANGGSPEWSSIRSDTQPEEIHLHAFAGDVVYLAVYGYAESDYTITVSRDYLANWQAQVPSDQGGYLTLAPGQSRDVWVEFEARGAMNWGNGYSIVLAEADEPCSLTPTPTPVPPTPATCSNDLHLFTIAHDPGTTWVAHGVLQYGQIYRFSFRITVPPDLTPGDYRINLALAHGPSMQWVETKVSGNNKDYFARTWFGIRVTDGLVWDYQEHGNDAYGNADPVVLPEGGRLDQPVRVWFKSRVYYPPEDLALFVRKQPDATHLLNHPFSSGDTQAYGGSIFQDAQTWVSNGGHMFQATPRAWLESCDAVPAGYTTCTPGDGYYRYRFEVFLNTNECQIEYTAVPNNGTYPTGQRDGSIYTCYPTVATQTYREDFRAALRYNGGYLPFNSDRANVWWPIWIKPKYYDEVQQSQYEPLYTSANKDQWPAPEPSEALVIVAHSDDETMTVAGRIKDHLNRNELLRVVIVSDSYGEDEAYRLIRRHESVFALQALGLDRSRIFFLDYAETSNLEGNAGLHDDLTRIMRDYQPRQRIYVHSSNDNNADHRAVWQQVAAVAAELRLSLDFYTFITHAGPETAWPGPGCAYCTNKFDRMVFNTTMTLPPNVGGSFQREPLPVGLTSDQKFDILRHYPSQYSRSVDARGAPVNYGYMSAFAKQDELFQVIPQRVPTVSVTPSSDVQGATFQQPGSGFTPNAQVTLSFQKPNGEIATTTEPADANGAYTHPWTSDCTTQPGTYTYWATDNQGAQAPSVTFTVASTPSCTPLSPTVSVTPSSDVQGAAFQQPGSGFHPNAQVTLSFQKPNGEIAIATEPADVNGAYAHTWTSDCTAQPGTQ